MKMLLQVRFLHRIILIIFHQAYNEVIQGQVSTSEGPQVSPIYVQVESRTPAAAVNNENSTTMENFKTDKAIAMDIIGTMIVNILFSVLCVVYLSIGLGRCGH